MTPVAAGGSYNEIFTHVGFYVTVRWGMIPYIYVDYVTHMRSRIREAQRDRADGVFACQQQTIRV